MSTARRVGRHEVPEESWISPKAELRESPGRGRGLFATAPIPAGEVVLVWGGESYTDSAGAAAARAEGRAVMQWDVDLFSREGVGDHDAFALNHSCDPNVWLEDTFRLTARRDIAPGEELGIDYATLPPDDDAPLAWDCRCGAAACRGRVTGSDWRRPDLQERYAGRFAPILARRIAGEEK
jgi:hypothetical protein